MPNTKSGRIRTWALRILHFGHGSFRLLWCAFLLLLCLLLYLWLVGLPGMVVNRALRHLDSQPFRVGLDRVHVDPTEGLVASGVFLYHQDDFSEPLAKAQRLVLKPDWRALITQGKFQLRGVAVHKGSVHLPARPNAASPATAPAIQAIEGRIRFTPERIKLDTLHFQLFTVNWQLKGDLKLSGNEPSPGFWIDLNTLLLQWITLPSATDDVVAELNAIRFDPPAQAQIALQLDPSLPHGLELQIQATGTTSTIRGANFDRLEADLHIAGPHLTANSITLGAEGHRCTLSGELDLLTRTTGVRIYSDLPPAPWIAVMPQRWQDELKTLNLTVDGGMRSEVWLGPAPLNELARNLHGWISLERGQFRGIPLGKAYCAIRVAGETVKVEHISAVIGQAGGQGPFEGSLEWALNTGKLSGQLDFNFDPNLALPLLSKSQSRIVRRFTFPNEPPRFIGRFRAGEAAQPGVTMEGQLTTRSCTYRGVPLTSIVSTLHYSNHVLQLDPFQFSRPEGTVAGSLHLDLETELYGVNLDGRMDPHAVAGIVGPHLAAVLAPTHYEQVPELAAHGVVDGGDSQDRTDLKVSVRGQRLGVTNWLADTVQLDLDARGGHYITTNASGTAFGGTFRASVHVTPDESGHDHTVRVLASITNAEMTRLIAQVRTNELAAGKNGKMDMTVDITAPVHDPGWLLLSGTGSAHVASGEIMHQRLFGGLSRLLSVLYPGLGFTAQDDLQADFIIQKGKISTKNARLAGSVISMKAVGYYAFDGKLKFRVEVQLLRKGPLASVLRFVTMPITKLLIFQLSGTLQDPRWTPVNLPKEMFLIFD